jgi:acyl-CoA thioesterase
MGERKESSPIRIEDSDNFDRLLERIGSFEKLFEQGRGLGFNVEEQVEKVFRADSKLFRLVGFEVLKMKGGVAELRFPYSKAITRRGGIVHGGVVLYTMDSACGMAVMTVNPGTDQLSLELNVSFLAPLRKGPFIAKGVVIRRGGSTAVAEGEIRDADGRLCAKALGTFYLSGKKSKE